MIDKLDLKIGNYVKQNAKPLCIDVVFKVEEIYNLDAYVSNHYTHQAGTFNYQELEPIPLTPSILEACGFSSTDDLVFVIKPNSQRHIGLIQILDEVMVNITGPFGLVQLHRIKHLHQLQNLYHSIYYTELTYNQKQ